MSTPDANTVSGWYEESGAEWDLAAIEWWEENVWHPDIEWRAIEGAPDDVGVMRGRERLRRYYGEWLELFEDIRQQLGEIHDVGERVVLAVHVTARSRSTDMPLELNYAIVYEFSDGRVRSGREYATVEEALTVARSAATAVSSD